MQFSLESKLSKLIASEHKDISIGINCHDMVVSTWYINDVLSRLGRRLLLFVNIAAFVEYIAPGID